MIKRYIKKLIAEQVPNERELRYMIGQCLCDALFGDKDSTYSVWNYKKDNKIEDTIRRMATKVFEENQRQILFDRIHCEEFIDEIVQRIKRKQLR